MVILWINWFMVRIILFILTINPCSLKTAKTPHFLTCSRQVRASLVFNSSSKFYKKWNPLSWKFNFNELLKLSLKVRSISIILQQILQSYFQIDIFLIISVVLFADEKFYGCAEGFCDFYRLARPWFCRGSSHAGNCRFRNAHLRGNPSIWSVLFRA